MNYISTKYRLIASMLTLITVIAWICLVIVHKNSQVEIPQDIQNILEPLNPNFDTQVLEKIP